MAGGSSTHGLLLGSLRHMEAGPEGKEARMRPLTPPTPEMVEVKRGEHLPVVGAMLRELAGQETLEAFIPPHQRHAVTVGEGMAALVLTLLTGEPARSRVA